VFVNEFESLCDSEARFSATYKAYQSPSDVSTLRIRCAERSANPGLQSKLDVLWVFLDFVGA
jgi:hypothetical protein